MQAGKEVKAAQQAEAVGKGGKVEGVERGVSHTTRVEGNTAKVVARSLGNLGTLRGAQISEVIELIPEGWTKMPLRKGEGIRYINPLKPGESISIEQGWKNAQDLIHSGPYVRITRDGSIIRIPLSGNPEL